MILRQNGIARLAYIRSSLIKYVNSFRLGGPQKIAPAFFLKK